MPESRRYVTMHDDADPHRRLTGMSSITVAEATSADIAGLTDVAAQTFPLACPPSVDPDDVAAFISTHLSYERFSGYLSDPARIALIAKDLRRIVGYAVLVAGTGGDDNVGQAVVSRPATELSKLYVVADQHGAGAASILMTAARRKAAEDGSRCLWLGVNQQNLRAQRFYLKQGFVVIGTRRFQLGSHFEDDYLMSCDL